MSILKIELDLVGHTMPLVLDIEIDSGLCKIIKENKVTSARFILAEKTTFQHLIIPSKNANLSKYG